jgi:hypothetical protein
LVKPKLYHGCVFTVCLLLAAGRSGAQFRGGVNLVEVYATVTDARGDPVTHLDRDSFIVEEDGVRQTLSAFAVGEFPLAVVLGIDRSFSMAGAPLAMAKAAGVRTDVIDQSLADYGELMARGRGDEDTSALIRLKREG